MTSYPIPTGYSNYTIKFTTSGDPGQVNLYEYRIFFTEESEVSNPFNLYLLLGGWNADVNSYQLGDGINHQPIRLICFSPEGQIASQTTCDIDPIFPVSSLITMKIVNNSTLTLTIGSTTIGTISVDLTNANYLILPNGHSTPTFTNDSITPPVPPEEEPFLQWWVWLLIGLGIFFFFIIFFVLIFVMAKKKK